MKKKLLLNICKRNCEKMFIYIRLLTIDNKN